MAPAETAALRVPAGRDQWWAEVRDALDGLTPAEVALYRAESRQMDAVAGDGLNDGREPAAVES